MTWLIFCDFNSDPECVPMLWRFLYAAFWRECFVPNSRVSPSERGGQLECTASSEIPVRSSLRLYENSSSFWSVRAVGCGVSWRPAAVSAIVLVFSLFLGNKTYFNKMWFGSEDAGDQPQWARSSRASILRNLQGHTVLLQNCPNLCFERSLVAVGWTRPAAQDKL
jgi:hypothetical protein